MDNDRVFQLLRDQQQELRTNFASMQIKLDALTEKSMNLTREMDSQLTKYNKIYDAKLAQLLARLIPLEAHDEFDAKRANRRFSLKVAFIAIPAGIISALATLGTAIILKNLGIL